VAHNPDRSSQGEGPSHDVTLRLQGPAVHDIALSFAERWNDPSNRNRTSPEIDGSISTNFLDEPLSPQGPHSVQVLRTYGIERRRAYSWSPRGEFTTWAAYIKAIKQAQQYIYIEDQYFYPFNKPSGYNSLIGKRRDSDIVYQLGEAIKRGVDVICLVPSRKGSHNPTNIYQLNHRREGATYLRSSTESRTGAGRFVICHLKAGQVDPVVHSKLMLVDDELALVGSANVCQRSMTYDTEIQLGVVDADNQFARDLRLALWQEHLDLTVPESILDARDGVEAFRANATSPTGRLGLMPTDAGHGYLLQGFVMNNFMDPYGGPDRD
jgi:phosphatidylserine/phosphatidylglycerophosphate/cardiolipin synthase-like enzyme